MNNLDKLIGYLSPAAGAARAANRLKIEGYAAATDSRLRKMRRSTVGANTAIRGKAAPLRNSARAFEEDSDLAKRVLDLLEQNVVGQGIIPEPTARTPEGKLHIEFNRLLAKQMRAWRRRPEVTHRHSDGAAQRLALRSLVRDGEVLAQHVRGNAAAFEHAGPFPYSYELIECDRLPLDYDGAVVGDVTGRIVQGIALNAWGEPQAYFLHPFSPDEFTRFKQLTDLKRKPAADIVHAALIKRISQLRGVSVFATIMSRLEDINDVDEAERVAVRIASSIGLAIYDDNAPKPSPVDPTGNTSPDASVAFEPGMLLHLSNDARAEVLESKRPTEALIPWRKGQVQAMAGGAGVTYSALANDYMGSYSSQRQELVEGFASYGIVASLFIEHWVEPIYRQAVTIATRTSKELRDMLGELDESTLFEAEYSRPAMPWVDPDKEAGALQKQWDLGIKTKAAMIRERGGIPDEVMTAVEDEKKANAKLNKLNAPPQLAPPVDQNADPDADPEADPAPAPPKAKPRAVQ